MAEERAHSEAQGQGRALLDRPSFDTRVNEGLEAFSAEVEEKLAIILLLLFGETVFGLGNFPLSTTLEGHETDSQVCSSCLGISKA